VAVEAADLESAQRELTSLLNKCKAVLEGSALSTGRRTLLSNRVAALQLALQLVEEAQARQDQSGDPG
jgi:hypothetical protein